MKAYKEMTFERLKNEKTEEFLLPKAPPKRKVLQNIRLLFISKIKLGF
jgi:hypothetical protein